MEISIQPPDEPVEIRQRATAERGRAWIHHLTDGVAVVAGFLIVFLNPLSALVVVAGFGAGAGIRWLLRRLRRSPRRSGTRSVDLSISTYAERSRERKRPILLMVLVAATVLGVSAWFLQLPLNESDDGAFLGGATRAFGARYVASATYVVADERWVVRESLVLSRDTVEDLGAYVARRVDGLAPNGLSSRESVRRARAELETLGWRFAEKSESTLEFRREPPPLPMRNRFWPPRRSIEFAIPDIRIEPRGRIALSDDSEVFFQSPHGVIERTVPKAEEEVGAAHSIHDVALARPVHEIEVVVNSQYARSAVARKALNVSLSGIFLTFVSLCSAAFHSRVTTWLKGLPDRFVPRRRKRADGAKPA